MRAYHALPEGYRESLSIDLQKNKKLSLLVNGISVLIAIALVVPMLFLVPISALFSMKEGLGMYILRFGAMAVLSMVYILLHEWIHGIAMRLCGTAKVKYGFTGLYAFAGSDDYYDKRGYLFIALAPVVLWGVVLAVLTPLVPVSWFWVVYYIQILNLSGAAGDFYVTAKFSRLPKKILVKDCGVSMTVYDCEPKS